MTWASRPDIIVGLIGNLVCDFPKALAARFICKLLELDGE